MQRPQRMALRLLTDKHIAGAIVVQLRRHGIDVVRVEEIGLDEADDTVILERATQDGRSVLSLDDDFDAIHAEWLKQGKNHCGIFRGMNHLQGSKGIGTIVKEIRTYHDLIDKEAGAVEEDVYNRIIFIS